jgi:hypothetical protein
MRGTEFDPHLCSVICPVDLSRNPPQQRKCAQHSYPLALPYVFLGVPVVIGIAVQFLAQRCHDLQT